MNRTCNAEDWEHVPLERRPLGAPCGQTYDDVDHSTLCPHAPLPPKLTEGDRARLLDKVDAAFKIGPAEMFPSVTRNRPDRDALREQRPDTELDA